MSHQPDGSDPGSVLARVRAAVYDGFLTRSAALKRAEIAELLSLSEPGVGAALERLAEAHMLVLQPESREVLMANPFSAVPSAYQVRSGDRVWWANCVWDSLGILAMTNRDGEVAASCPDCGEGLSLHVADGMLQPAASVVHFAVPARRWWEDIVYT